MRSLTGQAERIDARARPFERALFGVLTRYGLAVARRAVVPGALRRMAAVKDAEGRVVFAKTEEDEDLRRHILDLLLHYGMAAALDAARNAMREAGVFNPERILPERLVADALAGKPIRLRIVQTWRDGIYTRAERLTEATRAMVAESVRGVLSGARTEVPAPSAGELARRLATQFHGKDEEGRDFAFSPTRAELIARTELTQAENTGIYSGYKLAGVRMVEWLAYRDGRSGRRHHERMHGVRKRVGAAFVTPLGNVLSYPGDPTAPIEDTARCRCTVRAVR